MWSLDEYVVEQGYCEIASYWYAWETIQYNISMLNLSTKILPINSNVSIYYEWAEINVKYSSSSPA